MGTRVLQVQLDVGHGVGDVEGLVLALVHSHDVGGDAVIHDVVRLIYHDVQQVEPAAPGLVVGNALASGVFEHSKYLC